MLFHECNNYRLHTLKYTFTIYCICYYGVWWGAVNIYWYTYTILLVSVVVCKCCSCTCKCYYCKCCWWNHLIIAKHLSHCILVGSYLILEGRYRSLDRKVISKSFNKWRFPGFGKVISVVKGINLALVLDLPMMKWLLLYYLVLEDLLQEKLSKKKRCR